MKRVMQTVCVILIMAFLTVFVQPIAAVSGGSAPDEAGLISVSDGIIKWKKQSIGVFDDGNLLCGKFTMLAGTSSGDWYPIGLSRLGKDDNYIGYLALLKDNIERRYSENGGLDRVKATEWHRTVLAILASGGDPTALCTDENGKAIDLISDGIYNRGNTVSLGAQGISGWIWGLIALDGRCYEIPDGAYYSREDIIKEILCRQLDDGGFALSGGVSDPDITAMAIQALAPYYNDEKTYTYTRLETGNDRTAAVKLIIDEALERLSSLQLDSGDYRSWGIRNSGSVCQVIVALCSLGIDPVSDPRFIKNGNTLWDGLMIYRVSDGGFANALAYNEKNQSAEPEKSNSMAGEQALYAIAAMLRLKDGKRALYDFCDEMSDGMKGRISLLVAGISEIDGNTDVAVVKGLLSDFYSLPISDRRYVTNYHLLSDVAKSKGVDIASIAESAEVIEDIKPEREPLIFSEADKRAAEAIPEECSSEYYQQVTELLYRLDVCADFEERATYTERLSALKRRINAIKAEINDINSVIKDKASLTDEKNVKAIINRYNALSEYDRGLVENYDDVLIAQAKINTKLRAAWISAGVVALICVLSFFVFMRIKRRKTKKQRELEELSLFYKGDDE